MLTQKWSDYRLQSPRYLPYTNKIILDRRWQDIIWVPLVYIKNTIREDRLSYSRPNVYFTISNRTQVELSSFLSLEMRCDYKYLHYPVDRQECNLELISGKWGLKKLHECTAVIKYTTTIYTLT